MIPLLATLFCLGLLIAGLMALYLILGGKPPRAKTNTDRIIREIRRK